MKLVCYAYKNQNNELQAPFLDYLEKYGIHERDTEKKKEIKVKQIMNIKAHLEYLAENGGKYSLPPLTQQYRGRSIGILKISEASNLVRIAFYTKFGSTIALLDAIDKPKLYEKGKKIQVDKMIEKFLDRAERYKADYEGKNLSLSLTL